MRRKIRIGKLIMIHWPILTDGQETSLEGRDLTLVVTDPNGGQRQLPYSIDGNVVVAQYPGTMQKHTGHYTLTLWENKGKAEQTAVDSTCVFELVPRTEFECDGSGSSADVETLQLESSGLTAYAHGLSAYEIAVLHGYRGTEEEWVQSLYPALTFESVSVAEYPDLSGLFATEPPV